MKKKCIFPVALAAAMLVPLLTSAAGVLNRITYTASYNNNGLTIGTDTLGGVTYATVSYEDLYNGGEPGMPSLPIDYLKFSVPYNATNFTVTATTRWASQNLNYLVYPCQSPWMIGSPVPPIVLPDTSAYYSGNSYPSQMAWIADEGFLAGENHIVTVAVMPFRYKHTTNSDVLSRAINCVVTLRYDLSDSLAMSPIVRKDSLLREEGYLLTQSMVVNPGQVNNFAPTQTINPGIDSTGLIQGGIGGDLINGGLPDPTPVDPGDLGEEELLIDGGNYTYLIVTTSELKHAVRRIAALKRQKGYNVKIVTINEVLSSPLSGSGDIIGEGSNAHLAYTDDAGKLRQYLRNHYKYYGTKYVLLAGDVPHRIIPRSKFDYLTDLYYSDLSASWQDTITTDRNPELYVGRIVANHIGSNHVEQINNYTDKLFRYELNPGNGDYSYLRKALFSEGSKFSRYLATAKQNLNLIYPNPVQLDEGLVNNSLHPDGKDIIDTINSNPVSFLSIFNHGDTTRTRVYGYDCDSNIFFIHAIRPIIKRDGLNCLQNKYYPMIYYSPSCATIPFDNKNKLSFGESFITGKDYGGPVYIGYTRGIFELDGKSLIEAFSMQIHNGCVKLGSAFAMSIVDAVYEEHYSYLKHGYFGDPEVELWMVIPECYSDIDVTRTDNSVIISGLPPGQTIAGYLADDHQYKTKIVTTYSNTIYNVSPNSPIMLYQRNYIPYFAPLTLQNQTIEESQYVIANDVTAGESVDNIRTNGGFTISNGVEYEIEATGTVRLEDGFKVEKGATFAVYPSCF